VLASRTSSNVIGLETKNEATWTRIETAVRDIIRGAYHAA
jgi:hypothetical protein